MTRGRTAKGRRFLPGEGAARDLLQRLGLAAARRHRRRLAGTAFVGVTGSGGKTTTKDLVAAVLETELRGTKTPESLNRLTIVGRTILMTRSRHGFSVHEIPAFRPGSVAEFSALVQPTIAVVTRMIGMSPPQVGEASAGRGISVASLRRFWAAAVRWNSTRSAFRSA